MFRIITQVFAALLHFSGLLASMINVSHHAKCISLNNQPVMTRPTFINK